MNKLYATLLLALTLLLAACAGPLPAAVATPLPSSAGATSTPANPSSSGSVSAKVNVVPDEQSNLGFLISARVKEIDVHEGDQVKAGQVLLVLDTPELEDSVKAAAALVVGQQETVELLNYPYKVEFAGGRFGTVKTFVERRNQAQDQLEAAQAVLERAQLTLGEGTLVAPYDGTIVTINVKVGELVQPAEVVAVMGTLQQLKVQTTDLSERNIARVQIGQTATVHLKAFDQDLSGKVVSIAPLGEKSNGDVVFRVTIALDSPLPDLIWGMSGEVTIDTQN